MNCRYQQVLSTLTPDYVDFQGLSRVRYGLQVDPADPPVRIVAHAPTICPGVVL
jgi:hypothetical protein